MSVRCVVRLVGVGLLCGSLRVYGFLFIVCVGVRFWGEEEVVWCICGFLCYCVVGVGYLCIFGL